MALGSCSGLCRQHAAAEAGCGCAWRRCGGARQQPRAQQAAARCMLGAMRRGEGWAGARAGRCGADWQRPPASAKAAGRHIAPARGWVPVPVARPLKRSYTQYNLRITRAGTQVREPPA